MRSSHFLVLTASIAITYAYPNEKRNDPYSNWQPAGPNDARAPCPMLNTMSNHNFFPHSGRNITQSILRKALRDALNFDETFTDLLFSQAIRTNPIPNATFFNLDMLQPHNLLEHDASLSRSDAYFGNNFLFNETIFDETKSYWQGHDVIDKEMLTNAKIGRQFTEKMRNPTYTFTSEADGFSFGELLSPVLVFGDKEGVTVPRKFVEFWFENERLPTSLGWTKPKDTITREEVSRLDDILRNQASLITDKAGNPIDITSEAHKNPMSANRRRDVHAGYV